MLFLGRSHYWSLNPATSSLSLAGNDTLRWWPGPFGGVAQFSWVSPMHAWGIHVLNFCLFSPVNLSFVMRDGCQGSLRQEFRKVKKKKKDNCIFKILRKKHWKETQQVVFFYIDSSLNHCTLWNFHKSHPSQREVWDPSNQGCLGSSLRSPRIPVAAPTFSFFLTFSPADILPSSALLPALFLKNTIYTWVWVWQTLLKV